MKKIMLMMLLCCVLGSMPVYAQESIIMKYVSKWVGKLIPKPEEIAWIGNLTNAFYQVTQVLRSTKKLVDDYNRSYKQLVAAKEMLEKTYYDITVLFANFNPYDMDTWSSTLRGAQYIIEYDCGGALSAWGAADFVSPYARWEFDLDSLAIEGGKYDYRYRKNKQFIKEYYYDSEVDSLRALYAGVIRDYIGLTMTVIEAEILEWRQILDTAATEAERSAAREKLNELEGKLSAFGVGNIYNAMALNHEDTLLNFVGELVTYNLTNIQLVEAKVRDFETMADFLVGQFNDLKDGKATYQGVKPEGTKNDLDSLSTRVDTMYINDNHPDKGRSLGNNPFVRPDNGGGGFTKRVASYHDIAHLQNGIDFVLLQQEVVLRDVALTKARSATVIMAVEAYQRHISEMNSIMGMNDVLEALNDE